MRRSQRLVLSLITIMCLGLAGGISPAAQKTFPGPSIDKPSLPMGSRGLQLFQCPPGWHKVAQYTCEVNPPQLQCPEGYTQSTELLQNGHCRVRCEEEIN